LIISKNKKRRKKQEKILKKILIYPNPKYHDIILTVPELKEFKSLIDEEEIEGFINSKIAVDYIKKKYPNITINQGDLIGIRTENIAETRLPNIFLYLFLDKGIEYMAIRDISTVTRKRYEEHKNMKISVPYKLDEINKEDLLNIYHFPFIKGPAEKL
jgi:hypothetical protein